jgi:tRNA/tmRNA/rRNA uracil-C5-methylase (TrmA/RlmC/RlmD family)
MRLPVPLEVPIGAFFQGNRHLVPWLFERIGELSAAHTGPLYDLHAGVGYLAAAADPSGFRSEAVLVEPFRPAARAAARNLAHARVAVGRTAEAYLARHRRIDPDALVLADPPRAGMSAELRRRLAGWHPRSVLMLSCNPSTWARDTAFLLERGYALTHVELVDLFPSTHRVEVVSVLEAA